MGFRIGHRLNDAQGIIVIGCSFSAWPDRVLVSVIARLRNSACIFIGCGADLRRIHRLNVRQIHSRIASLFYTVKTTAGGFFGNIRIRHLGKGGTLICVAHFRQRVRDKLIYEIVVAPGPHIVDLFIVRRRVVK